MIRKNINILLFLVTICATSIDAKIYEISKINQVLKHLNPNKRQLVVFDIDNTLLCPKTDLGSDQWVSYSVKQNLANGMEIQAAYDKLLPTYFHVAKYIDLVPTESNIQDTINKIEELCDHTICLTARSLCISDITFTQLYLNRLLFKIPELNECKLNLPSESLYKAGILFCGPNCKGIVITSFLDAIDYTPEEIIVVDDKAKNLSAVEGPVEARGISFVGLRYSGCDKKIAEFDINTVNKELNDLLKKHPQNN